MKIFNKIRGNKDGFTLVELLVSMMIFMIFLGIVGQAYISIVRAQRDANEVRKMYSDVRSVMDLMAEQIRLGSVDYDCYHIIPPDFNLSCPEKYIAGKLIQSNTENSFVALVGEGGKEKITFKVENGRVW
ncbi:prepilin-type N-terminal cleavage/methylation domain-containing protein, partial [Patescibacteria group bacterium]|nr:prepilin-type N-terminal cleavage/methylation domain-containing protein [Patescibacteria group bacterium]